MQKITLPEYRLKDYVKTIFINYALVALICNVIFWGFFGLRLAVRALDVIAVGGNVYGEATTFSQRMQVYAESALVLVSFYGAVKSGVLFYGVCLNIHRIKQTNELLLSVGCSCGVDGQQGVGKTRLLVYMLVLQACAKMRTLALKYFIDYPLKDKLKERAENGDDVDWIAFQNREDAIEFYFRENPDRIPGAYSNILVTWNDKKPYYLEKEHFTMKKRLHEGNVKLLSEADNVLANTIRKGKKKDKESNEANDIDEFVGLDRQYTDGMLLTDSHANGAIFKSIRDCQQVKLHLLRSEYTYCPKALKRYHKKLEEKVLKAQFEMQIPLRNKIKRVEALMRNVGFTKIYYIKENGVDKTKTLTEERFLVLPNQVPYAYNDRVLQKQYRHAPKIKKQEPTQEQATKN